MSSLLNLENFLDPGNYLVGAGVRWLVKIDDSVVLKNVNRSGNRRMSFGKRGEMIRFHVKLVVIL